MNNVFFSWKKKFLNNWPPILALLIQNDKIVNIVNVTGLLHYLTGKTQKLKRAKEEAQAEIRSYREEREKQFMDYQREHMGSKDDFQAKIEEQTSVRLDQISESIKKNQDKVIDRLLSLVYDIKPELHQNLRT